MKVTRVLENHWDGTGDELDEFPCTEEGSAMQKRSTAVWRAMEAIDGLAYTLGRVIKAAGRRLKNGR